MELRETPARKGEDKLLCTHCGSADLGRSTIARWLGGTMVGFDVEPRAVRCRRCGRRFDSVSDCQLVLAPEILEVTIHAATWTQLQPQLVDVYMVAYCRFQEPTEWRFGPDTMRIVQEDAELYWHPWDPQQPPIGERNPWLEATRSWGKKGTFWGLPVEETHGRTILMTRRGKGESQNYYPATMYEIHLNPHASVGDNPEIA